MATAERRESETDKIKEKAPSALRLLITVSFTRVEDAVYVGLGLLLAASAAALLVSGAVAFWVSLRDGAPVGSIVNVLDRILLVLLIIELLYTVKVSFREHSLVPEPFLIVGLIAATRRILIVTAQFAAFLEKGADEGAFRRGLLELALLTVMIVALVVSLFTLRKRAATGVAES